LQISKHEIATSKPIPCTD